MVERLKKVAIYSVLLVTVIIGGVGFYMYKGNLVGQESSPNGLYTLRYYKTFNPLKLSWTMPGDSSCTPYWIRLFDDKGNKLKERYTNGCSLEMEVHWIDKQLLLPDGSTVWELPSSSESHSDK